VCVCVFMYLYIYIYNLLSTYFFHVVSISLFVSETQAHPCAL